MQVHRPVRQEDHRGNYLLISSCLGVFVVDFAGSTSLTCPGIGLIIDSLVPGFDLHARSCCRLTGVNAGAARTGSRCPVTRYARHSANACEIRTKNVKVHSNRNAKRPAVFLDRDGVINAKLPEGRYVRYASEFRLLPGVIQALRTLEKLGYLRVLITNQRGIGRGLMTEEQLEAVHARMKKELQSKGVTLDAVYYCPHDEHENCSCRKPQPGMILNASRDLEIDLSLSYMVGDSPADIGAGKQAGTRTVRIALETDETADLVFKDLAAFAKFLDDRAREDRSSKEDSKQ